MPLLSDYARSKKIALLLEQIRPGDSVLEIGAGDGWLGPLLAKNDIRGYRSIDLQGPADYIGDIRQWESLGIPEASFDFIVALEVIEHVPCLEEIYSLLKPGGRFFATSPVPHWDWLCALLERLGLSQRRTSPHSHLVYFDRIPFFKPILLKRFGLLSQWGLFLKPLRDEKR